MDYYLLTQNSLIMNLSIANQIQSYDDYLSITNFRIATRKMYLHTFYLTRLIYIILHYRHACIKAWNMACDSTSKPEVIKSARYRRSVIAQIELAKVPNFGIS